MLIPAISPRAPDNRCEAEAKQWPKKDKRPILEPVAGPPFEPVERAIADQVERDRGEREVNDRKLRSPGQIDRRGGYRNRSSATMANTSSAATALCAVASGSGNVFNTMIGPSNSCATSVTARAPPAMRTPRD